MRSILLSIKPIFTNAIYAGLKSIELRRKIGSDFFPGNRIYIYSSTPIQKITGEASIKKIHKGGPLSIKAQVLEASCVLSQEYDSYFEGSDMAYGIELDDVKCYQYPVSISVMKAKGIVPPQSFRYLTDELVGVVRGS